MLFRSLTNSYWAVGAIGAAELIPLTIFGLYGGVLADHFDRRKLILFSEAAALLMTVLLFANAILPNPNLAFIYVITGAFAALDGLSSPAMGAIIPRIIKHEDMVAAQAIMTIRWQVGVIIGPSIGGLVIATWNVKAGYALDALSYLLSIFFMAKIAPVPVDAKGEKPSLEALYEDRKSHV